MKRLIAAAALVLFIIIICVVSRNTVLASVASAKNSIEECEKLFNGGDYRAAELAATGFKDKWESQSVTLTLFSNHCRTDDINMLAAALPDAAASKNKYEFYSAVSKIKYVLDMIYKENTFALENLY